MGLPCGSGSTALPVSSVLAARLGTNGQPAKSERVDTGLTRSLSFTKRNR